MVENTKYCTHMVSKGFRKLQNTPRIDRLYFVLKSLDTNCLIRKRYFFTARNAFARKLCRPVRHLQ